MSDLIAKAATRSRKIARLLDRCRFIGDALRDHAGSPASLSYYAEELDALDWIVSEYFNYETEHGQDEEWKLKLKQLVPIDEIVKRIELRKQTKNFLNQRSRQRKLLTEQGDEK